MFIHIIIYVYIYISSGSLFLDLPELPGVRNDFRLGFTGTEGCMRAPGLVVVEVEVVEVKLEFVGTPCCRMTEDRLTSGLTAMGLTAMTRSDGLTPPPDEEEGDEEEEGENGEVG